MQTRDCDVVIVGAGVAGGGLAATLRDTGLSVVVLEAAPRIPIINRGDQMAPPIVAYLGKIGALPYFEARGSEKVYVWTAFGPEGEVIGAVDLRDLIEPPYNYILTLPHTQIQASLLDFAAQSATVEILRGVRVRDLLKDAAGRATGVRGVIGDEPVEIRARVVAGCDGVRSLVRQQAGIDTSIEWLEEFPMITATRHPEQSPEVNWEVWGATGFLGLFPISKEHVRCPVQGDRRELARWRQIGLAQVRDELAAKFRFWDRMQIVDEDLHIYRTCRHHAEGYVADGLVLIGEAAHTTPPFYGFGMAMAIRDGREATKVIVDALAAGETDARRLRGYEDAVREYNAFAIEKSSAYERIATRRIPTAETLQQELSKTTALDPAVMGRLYRDW